MSRVRRLLLLLLLATVALPAAAADLEGWDATRWGMTQADIDRLYGGRLRKPDKPIQYGGARAEAALPNIMVGGMPFVVSFLLGADGRLQQVLVERRRGAITNDRFRAVLDTLRRELGPPDLECLGGGDPQSGSFVWQGPVTTVHALLFGYSSDVLTVNPSREVRRPVWKPREEYRGLPIRPRILLRYHPTARADLFGRREGCRKASG
ncbi:MAG: hypothetical protein IT561_20560 [Alphaproteobacteria bacterium]|nr:hypothetical protein [Alphaproteobacteria bacterium]